MAKRRTLPVPADVTLLFAIGVALVLAPIVATDTALWRRAVLLDWPAIAGLSQPGLGIGAVGVAYTVGAAGGALAVVRGGVSFREALLVPGAVAPLLVGLHWLYGRQVTSVGAGLELPFAALLVLPYLPVAFGFPLGVARDERQLLLVTGLAVGLVAVPVAWLARTVLASGGFPLLLPGAFLGTLLYTGVCASPLYRFARHRVAPAG